METLMPLGILDVIKLPLLGPAVRGAARPLQRIIQQQTVALGRPLVPVERAVFGRVSIAPRRFDFGQDQPRTALSADAIFHFHLFDVPANH